MDEIAAGFVERGEIDGENNRKECRLVELHGTQREIYMTCRNVEESV